MAKKADKTNAMRILDRKKLPYQYHTCDSAKLNAVEVADSLGLEPGRLFKTLVTVGRSGEHYVFMVPGEKDLDLKKAAKAAGEKSLEMLPQKDLLPLTGYIHGGCSPIGMKRQFVTFIDFSAESFETIYFSGGCAGYQIQMAPDDLQKAIEAKPANIAKDT